MDKKIKILMINGGPMDFGGISMFMFNITKYIDTSAFDVHLLSNGKSINKLNSVSKIIEITSSSENRKRHIKEYVNLLRVNNYDIVHSNADSLNFLYLYLAKKNGIKYRISHVHNTKHLTNSRVKNVMFNLLKGVNKVVSTHLFACSPDAGKYFYGKKPIQNGSCIIINNAIEFKKYKFSEVYRQKIREDLKLKDLFVIGHVGRFDYQKNHKFILEYFSNYSKINDKARLVLIGDGHLKNEIISITVKLKIYDKTIFLGNISNVNDYYNIFDLFILPSLFEGLGIVLIEAQANGLKCLASNYVPLSSNVLGHVDFLSLNDINKWVNSTDHICSNSTRYKIDSNIFKNTGYLLEDESFKLQKIYKEIINKIR